MSPLTLRDISSRLTEEVIQKCFRRVYKDDSVESIAITRAAAAGEGLISAVYRIHVKGSRHETSFVAKGLVGDPLLRISLRCAKYFKREIIFFSEILPLYKTVQELTGAKERIQDNVPFCYAYHLGDDTDFLLLEDLSLSFCKSITEKPTISERNNTLKALAHLHAVSMAVRVKRPKEFDEIVNNILIPDVYYNEDNHAWYAQYLKNALNIDQQIISEYENEDSIYYRKFMELLKTDVYQQLRDLTTYRGLHPVLNHGDAWMPNFMSSDVKVVAIDFQLFRCSSLVTDLSFFLTLCCNLCSSKEEYMKAVKVYYDYLGYYLKDMGLQAAEVYSWDDLMEELKEYGRFGLLASLTTIPLLASQKCDVQKTFVDDFVGVERIPLEDLWTLTPIGDHEQKMVLVNAVRIAVDLGLI